MPLQNRVAPTGEIVVDPARGLLMGNRGCLHGQTRQLGPSRWRSKLWICCLLSWKEVRRDPMPPGKWTALFFLDEATALAAGHRPCGYCRRADFLSFADAWRRAYGLTDRPLAPEMDGRLHGERVDSRSRKQITRPAIVGALPDGAMVGHEGAVWLVVRGHLLPWSFDGYGAPQPVSGGTMVELLTPPSTVAAIRGGYRPLLHPSARALQLRVEVAIEQFRQGARR